MLFDPPQKSQLPSLIISNFKLPLPNGFEAAAAAPPASDTNPYLRNPQLSTLRVKMLLTHLHTVALCVYGTRLFPRRPTLLNAQPLKLHLARVSVRLDDKLGYGTRSMAPVAGHRILSFQVTSQVNDSGSIKSPLMESMEKKIRETLNAELVTVNDAYGDGRHVSIDVVASAFEGVSAVNRQRMVYKAIWEELQNTVHAVDQMTTRTPNEAGSK